MAVTFIQCIGWGILFSVFIIIIGYQFWYRDSYSTQNFKAIPPLPLAKCNYSPRTSEICLNGIGSKDSCISCSVNDNLIRLTDGDLNKYLSHNLSSGTYPIQFINKRGEFINIVRYNDIKCNYDEELTVKGKSVIPCVINNALDAFLPSSSLTQYIQQALHLGIIPLNAIPYKEH